MATLGEPTASSELSLGQDTNRAHSPGSTISDPDLEQDPHDGASTSSPLRAGETDPRNRLQHVLGESPHEPRHQDGRAAAHTPSHKTIWMQEGKEMAEAEGDNVSETASRTAGGNSALHAGLIGRRITGTGQPSSVYSGNKIKHLKKDDGVPLWRKDIQYEFLRAVFEDETKVFTDKYSNTPGHSFAQIYIHTMANSSKTSKILKEKLMSEHRAAIHMAMVCLLVNVGRMNTTLNFFPEMRAQLRTYHSIPSLQARQDPNAYKQLQDAPRLKSILKGASEDAKEPNSIEAIMAQPKPRTNAVNLVFVLSSHAIRVSETHFTPPREFFDLITRTTISSRSRAKTFLWLMWWYLESDFTKEDAERNPFGPGQASEDGGMPVKVPPFDYLTEEQADAENVDTEEEIAYGETKRVERIRINEADALAAAAPRRGKKGSYSVNGPSDDGLSPAPDSLIVSGRGRGRGKRHSGLENYGSDSDRTRSATPPVGAFHSFDPSVPRSGMRINSMLNDDQTSTPLVAPRTGRGRWPRDKSGQASTQRLILKTKMDHVPDNSSPAPPGAAHPVLHPEHHNTRRQRPMTAHQQAVEKNRAQRVDYILDRKMRKVYQKKEKLRSREGAIWRAWNRQNAMVDPFANSEDEDSRIRRTGGPVRDQGFGGLMALETEEDDYGEEINAYAAALRRSSRRLDRWDMLRPGEFSRPVATKPTNGVPKYLHSDIYEDANEDSMDKPREYSPEAEEADDGDEDEAEMLDEMEREEDENEGEEEDDDEGDGDRDDADDMDIDVTLAY